MGTKKQATDAAVQETPLAIIEEIEQLARITGNVAMHEHQRLVQRLADLKNHPDIKVDA